MVYKFEAVPWGLKTVWYFQELKDSVPQILTIVNKKKFDAIIMPIFPANIEREGNINDFIKHSYLKSELEVKSDDIQKLHFLISNLSLSDENKEVRKRNREILKQEIQFAAYLGVPSIILSSNSDPIKLAKFIRKMSIKYFIDLNTFVLDVDITKDWIKYNQIRQELQFNIPILLRLKKEMTTKNEQRKWLSENIRFVHLNQDLFSMNDQGAPKLEDAQNQFLTSYFQFENYISIAAKSPQIDLADHRQYLIHLFKNQQPLSEQANLASEFFDELQIPLQPYKDNLNSGTYEVFEQDKIKYDLYEDACRRYLKNVKKAEINILMAGAGRGGILERVIFSAQGAKCKTKIVALEKNPYAYMTLVFQKKRQKQWKDVEIVLGDLKSWQTELKFDLIVSELLGSFGDNELSPECLMWAQRFLQPDAVSIPCDSVSYCVPVSCPQLHAKVKKSYGYDSSYVVHFQKYYTIHDIQKCMQFKHPDFNNENQLAQEQNLVFECKQDLLIHGMAGYFTSKLYEDIELSTHPNNSTPDMYSWFPIYFPFEKPVNIAKKQKLKFTIKRVNNEEGVWYEWFNSVLSEDDQLLDGSRIHNENGKKQIIEIK
ncbi:unnamed protein product [Paramecium octaurelia]|uniref:Protein arginine N-methyltransferase n=1 Tax=Paramecium octaurelia TaxID=43137 RepID=A0A8S1YJ00_PAROT|nr:unnamed protein product [Paramecium octaurelia]